MISRWLLAAVVVLSVAACGTESASTGKPSADAIIATVTSFAGEDAEVSGINVLWEHASTGDREFLRLVIACQRETGDCLLVAPDGAGYSNMA